MFKRLMLAWPLAIGTLMLAACGSASGAVTPETPVPVVESAPVPAGVDLEAIKQYALDYGLQMKGGTAALAVSAQTYYDRMAAHNFDYAAAWADEPEALTQDVADLKANWLAAHIPYELNEGVIAGVPSLASYDVWIDAGPSAEEDPAEAYQWTLELPDGRTLERPGNLFHSLLEPTIWGTNPTFVGLPVDLDGNGTIEVGEALPEANMVLAASKGIDNATGEMVAAVEAWQPSMSDAFTALVVMIPTMNEYFEQWKLSSYVAGQDSTEQAFIGTSRLVDINGILKGLDITYQNVSPVVQTADPAIHDQVTTGFADLRSYVGNLYQQEIDGTVFTAEQADLFGTEAQSKATALAGQISQVAALLNIDIAE